MAPRSFSTVFFLYGGQAFRAIRLGLSGTRGSDSNDPRLDSTPHCIDTKFFSKNTEFFLQKYQIFLRTAFHTGFFSKSYQFVFQNPVECTRLILIVL
jgi:hypothetical protein